MQALGFLGIGGDKKVRLLPTAWPTDALPPPTSSLLAVASKKGLVAAAGPDYLVLATTSSVRDAFAGETKGDENVLPFEPQLKIPMQTRIAQVVFSADETFLIISAESGGGLAVYDVDSLLQGKTQPSFELSTNGTALRAVAPNPTAERAELLAIILVNGDLMMANLRQRHFTPGRNGPVLLPGVSCMSWSKLGKQLVAGLGDGAVVQLTPEGEPKASVPRPPQLEGDQHGKTRICHIYVSSDRTQYPPLAGWRHIHSSLPTRQLNSARTLLLQPHSTLSLDSRQPLTGTRRWKTLVLRWDLIDHHPLNSCSD